MVFQNEFTKHLETDEVWGMASVKSDRLSDSDVNLVIRSGHCASTGTPGRWGNLLA